MAAAAEYFRSHLPPKPYCTDDLTEGLKIRALKIAIEKSYIQPNGPGMVWVMVKDVDRAVIDPTDWWPVWETAGLPEPNMAVLNRRTKRGHLIYLLAAGVSKTSAARLAPLRFLSAVDQAYTLALGADTMYSGLICKNPFSDRWKVWEVHGNPFTLDDLAKWVDLTSPAITDPKPLSEIASLGRNCAMFDEGRKWAYQAIRDHWAPNGLPRWQEAVLGQLRAINGQFHEPLPFSEVKATARSIAKWTWRNITPQGLQELIDRTHTPEKQAERGKASGKARRLSREQDRATARLMRAQGLTYPQIAAEFGIGLDTAWRWCQ
ncbi:replication initiation protein [Acidithiobacillus thiooxidans]|uniref:replication initiation protein n=1 Tax=Acidithiobacillus thiooxidans TaxID=930 RepID=UPI001C07D715|nr:replication initiation protein [Acidithiobacillus thiooxidans]MBU2843693.1 hypothetical protein [Acidithiobacillus thiooxidans]